MAMGEISIIGAMRDSAEDDKGDGRGLCGQGSVFADFIRCCWLSEGCGRPRRPCHRLLHSDLFRLAVVTAFSLKLAAALGGRGLTARRPEGADAMNRVTTNWGGRRWRGRCGRRCRRWSRWRRCRSICLRRCSIRAGVMSADDIPRGAA